ncbi:MAG TPA: hypothetical protein VFO66_06665 [Gemmatimonadaceae bacterium]|nr:hypothetical protein [Gemmatimonadaceae bacterium]
MKTGPRLSALGSRLLLLVLLLGLVRPAHAQPPQQADRARLEGEIRRGFARAVRQRVGLTDDQMRRLAPLTQKHETQRRQLQADERRARVALQTELRAPSPDSAVVARQLDSLLAVHRRRLQLTEAEHRELATVMSPVQRARYFALQEQFRRRVEQMRQGGPPR